MIGEALAVAAQRVGVGVLARIGGAIGERARAAAAELAALDASAQKLVRAEWIAIARAPVPPGLRGVHASWIEHALETLPARARAAVAGQADGATEVWLARWATAELVAMPAPRPGPPRVPDDAALLDATALLEWLAAIGNAQLAYAIGHAAREDPIVIGARTLAPHLSTLVRRQVVLRLPRAVGLAVARAFREYAASAADQGPAWAALVT